MEDIGCLLVVTGSMEPTINIKELVVIKEQKEYKVEDIVTYRDHSNHFVTHRIVSKVGKTVVTRGDNNSVSDEPIRIEEIEGKVCYHSVILGEFILYWLKPILVFMMLLILISSVKDFILVRRKKRDEEKA